MAESLFWTCLALPACAWLGYPLLLMLWAPFCRRAAACPSPPEGWPASRPLHVSVVIAAHNEQARIAAKLDNLLQQQVELASLQVLVASDGSSDATVAIARQLDDPRITVLDLPRQGKNATLNAAVAHCQGEILVFTDADIQWLDGTFAALLAPFADPDVGASGGNLLMPLDGRGLRHGEALYRRHEAWLRQREAHAGCVVAVDGALQALRRELWQPIPAQVNDDFFISTCAPAAGRRVAYVDQARALDHGTAEAERQFSRRQRVTVGGLRSLQARRGLLDPRRHGLYAIALICHKLLRRLAPVLLLPLLLSNLLLLDAGLFYQLSLGAQLLGYAVALIGLGDDQRRLPRLFRLAAFVLVTAAGMSCGLWQFLRGQHYAQWTPNHTR